MSTSVKVSIVIAVYNAGDTITRMLKSVSAQTEPSFEVICVNDGSTDNGKTAALLEAYALKDPRVRVVTQENSGAVAAFNHGISLANGHYFYACDQDDMLHPQLLEYCIWAMEAYQAEFLTFRHSDFHDHLPVFSPLPTNFETIPHLIADDELRETNPEKYLQAHMICTDKWGHFSTMKRAKEYKFSSGKYKRSTNLRRPFVLLQRVSRWIVSEAVLYFYDNGNPNSMTQKAIKIQNMKGLWDDMQAIFNLYEKERNSGDPIGLWKNQCGRYIIQPWWFMKSWIVRSKKFLSRKERNERWQLLADIIYDFVFRKGIPLSWICHYTKRKHRFFYLRLLIRFKLLPRLFGQKAS